MKKQVLLKVASVVLSLLSAGNLLLVFANSPQTGGNPDLDSPGQTDTVYSVADFGADGSDSEDDWPAFSRAAQKALDADGVTKINIPAGTYYLSKAVPVYSDTLITAEEGATIISTFNETGSILYGAHLTDGDYSSPVRCPGGAECNHGGHSQTKNITVIGGVWDRGADINSADTSVFSFRHASNITFKDLTVLNSTDHMINLSGTDTALLENVTVKNHIDYKGTDRAFWGAYDVGDENRYNSIEAVHLDYCGLTGESSDYAAPHDNTPAANITVSGCVFENVYSCVGTHHPAEGSRTKNITVTGNKMTGIRSYCVFADGFDNLVISGNTAGAASLARLRDSKATVNGNTLYAVTDKLSFDGIYIIDNTTLTASKNTISGAGVCGINAHDGCTVKAENNEIRNSAKHALYISKSKAEFVSNTVSGSNGAALRAANASSLTAKNNTVTGAGEMAIYCTESSPLTATGNIINGTGSKKPAIKVLSSKAVISGNTVNSSSHDGIVIWQSSGSTVKNNAVKNTAAVGIHIYGSTGCTVSGNTVTAAKNHGIMVEGEKGLPGTATLSKNTLSTSGGFNIRLGKYAVKCVLDRNTLKNKTFSADATASYITYLSAPKLTGVSNAKAGITVKWNKVSGAANYRIFRKTGSGEYKKLADVSGKTVSFTDKTAKSGTKYTYTVRCLWTDGKTYAGDYDKTGKTLLRLSSPDLKKITPGNKKIAVVWSKVAGAKGYYIYRKTGSGKWSKIAATAKTSYTDKKVTKGKKYSYTVYAYNGKTKSAAGKSLAAKAK